MAKYIRGLTQKPVIVTGLAVGLLGGAVGGYLLTRPVDAVPGPVILPRAVPQPAAQQPEVPYPGDTHRLPYLMTAAPVPINTPGN